MPLAGTFDVLDFGEVLDLLCRRSATGRLTSRTMTMNGTIWLAEGQATAAEISSQTGTDSKAKWQSQLEDFCFDALRSSKGSFEFHPEDDDVAVRSGAPVSLDDVIEAGRQRLEKWHEVEATIHSFEAVPRMAETIEETVEVDQEAWRILVALDGRHNVASLAKRLGQDLLAFCLQLKPLIESGAVILEQPDGWLKSLPKVRLEVASRDGEVFIDSLVDASAEGSPAPDGSGGPEGFTGPERSPTAQAEESVAVVSDTPGSSSPADSTPDAGPSGAVPTSPSSTSSSPPSSTSSSPDEDPPPSGGSRRWRIFGRSKPGPAGQFVG